MDVRAAKQIGRVATGAALIVLLLIAPGYWLQQNLTADQVSVGQLALASLGLLLIAVLVLFAGSAAAAWALGLTMVMAPPLLIGLGATAATVPADLSLALNGLIYVYAAGAAGGLVMELLSGRLYQLELPSPGRRPAPGGAPHVPPAEGDFGPHGPLADLGFAGRMFTGGLAGLVFSVLALVIIDGAGLAQLANLREPANLAWAVAAGAVSPAVWEGLGGLVKSRSGHMHAMTERARAEVEQARIEPAVDPASLVSPATRAELARAQTEEDVTELLNRDADLKAAQSAAYAGQERRALDRADALLQAVKE